MKITINEEELKNMCPRFYEITENITNDIYESFIKLFGENDTAKKEIKKMVINNLLSEIISENDRLEK